MTTRNIKGFTNRKGRRVQAVILAFIDVKIACQIIILPTTRVKKNNLFKRWSAN